jgi:putative addiction module killer protein
MDAHKRQVFYYRTPSGKVIVKTWLESLRDPGARARIRLRLGRIEEGSLGDYRPAGGGVMELRVDYGPGYRIYFAFAGRVIVVLLCGGDKKTQPADIRQAGLYWSSYKKGGG